MTNFCKRCAKELYTGLRTCEPQVVLELPKEGRQGSIIEVYHDTLESYRHKFIYLDGLWYKLVAIDKGGSLKLNLEEKPQ